MKYSHYSALLLTLAAATVLAFSSAKVATAHTRKHHAEAQSQSASHHAKRHHHTDAAADQAPAHTKRKRHHSQTDDIAQSHHSRRHARDRQADQSDNDTSIRHHRHRQAADGQSDSGSARHLSRKERLHEARLENLHEERLAKLHEKKLHEERLAEVAAEKEHSKHLTRRQAEFEAVHLARLAKEHRGHESAPQAEHLARLERLHEERFAKIQALHNAHLAAIQARYKAHLARLAAIRARHLARLQRMQEANAILTPSPSIRAWNDYAAGVPMKIIVVDMNDPRVEVCPLLSSNGIGSSEPFSHMIARSHPDVAVTGTFFSLDNLHPIGDIVINGNLAYFGGMGTALCITPNNKADMITVPWGHHHDWSGYECVVACGPRLLEGGKIVLDPHAERFKDQHMLAPNSRIGVGITKDNKLVFVMTRKAIYLGRLAKAMKDLGCEQAMNLDAGTSTGFYCDGHLMARPGRRLTNAILVFANHKPVERTAGSSAHTEIIQAHPPA